MRVLITGADGQVGRELVAVFAAGGHDVVATDQRSLDVSDRDQVLQAVADQPLIVSNRCRPARVPST